MILCCQMFRLSLILRSCDQVRKLWPFHSIHCWIQQVQSYVVQYYHQNQRPLIQISFPLSVNSTSGIDLSLCDCSLPTQRASFPLILSLIPSPFPCSLSQRAVSLHPSSCAYPNTQEASGIHSIGRNYLFPQMSWNRRLQREMRFALDSVQMRRWHHVAMTERKEAEMLTATNRLFHLFHIIYSPRDYQSKSQVFAVINKS